jgi:hypothetical protein
MSQGSLITSRPRRYILFNLTFLALLGLPTGRLAAQVKHDVGLQLTGATGRPAILGLGPVWAWRPGLRDRVLLHVGLGVAEHQLATRAEAQWQFLLQPLARTGVGVYAGAGLAGQAAETTKGWIVAVLGVESRPGGPAGWTAELGIGGGIRAALGYRWRRNSK